MPRWLPGTLVILLAAQVGLTWMHGSLLNRQHGELQALSQDIQELSDSLDAQSEEDAQAQEDYSLARRPFHSRRHRAVRPLRVLYRQQPAPEDAPKEESQAQKELRESRESAQRALKDARKVQSQLSWEENARKADEKAKLESAQNSTLKWIWIAMGIGVLALVVRSWLRRRS